MDLHEQVTTRETGRQTGVTAPEELGLADGASGMSGAEPMTDDDVLAFLDMPLDDETVIPEASPEVEGILASLAAEAQRLHGQRANPVGDETSASIHVMPTPDQQMAEMRMSKERLAILALARHLLPHLLVAMADRDASGVAGAAICHAEAFTKKSKTYLESGIY